MSSFTVPSVPEAEPDVAVPASVVGDAAEILNLIGELIDHDRDGAVRARIEALLDAAGAEPRPAADWLIASVRRLAREAEAILAYEGISAGRRLPDYWRPPRARRQEG
jgi:hypothetical protein